MPHRGETLPVAGVAPKGFVDPDEVVASVPDGGVLYVCGPNGLLTAVRSAWERAAKPPAGLRFETFGTGGSLPATPFRVCACVSRVAGASLTIDC